jgi:hypothetical protein
MALDSTQDRYISCIPFLFLTTSYFILLLFLANEFYLFLVVDVVRTDSHLEFYEDRRNLARMSDILAVYAWVDPATGYCQGYVFSCKFLGFLTMLGSCYTDFGPKT